MSNLLLITMFLGFTCFMIGLGLCYGTDELYCEELGYKADIKHWKNYAKSLIDSKPMRKELDLMDRERFKAEMYLLYKLTLKEI